MPIFGQKVRLMSASKPPNMKVQLSLELEVDNFFDLGVDFFFSKFQNRYFEILGEGAHSFDVSNDGNVAV